MGYDIDDEEIRNSGNGVLELLASRLVHEGYKKLENEQRSGTYYQGDYDLVMIKPKEWFDVCVKKENPEKGVYRLDIYSKLASILPTFGKLYNEELPDEIEKIGPEKDKNEKGKIKMFFRTSETQYSVQQPFESIVRVINAAYNAVKKSVLLRY